MSVADHSEARTIDLPLAFGEPSSASSQVAGAQSIRRALSILRVLAVGRDQGLRLNDIVRETDLNRPTVHRMLSVLAEEGLVQQHPQTRRYAIGHHLWMLALARRARYPLCDAAAPYLQEVSQLSGDTTLLAIPTGLDLLSVDRRLGHFPVQILSLDPGGRRPLGIGAASIAILACLSAKETAAIVDANARRYRSQKVSAAEVLAQVAAARRRGYAFNARGIIAGTKAIAVAIRDPAGVPVGAICIAAIAKRMTPARVEELATMIKLRTDKITAALTPSKPMRH
jgi:DNA-binding IclR family transcriptional regulator